jgi:hypothetical protein
VNITNRLVIVFGTGVLVKVAAILVYVDLGASINTINALWFHKDFIMAFLVVVLSMELLDIDC